MVTKEVKKRKIDQIDLLLENSIALQKTMTNLAIELKTLNKKVSSLLALFEGASREFKKAQTVGSFAPAPDMLEELMEKMNELSKQNQTIAKGLLLLEETVRESKIEEPFTKKPKPKPQPLPEFSF